MVGYVDTENIGYRNITPELLLCHRSKEDPRKRIYHPMRTARNYEVVFVQDKPDIHSVNDKEYFAYPEDIIFLKPGDRTYSYSYGTNYMISFCLARTSKDTMPGCDFINHFKTHHIIADNDKDKYANIIRDIFGCFEAESPEIELRTKALLVFLVHMLCKDSIEKDKYISKSMEYIDSNICQSTSVDYIVVNSGISNVHYHRLFKEVTGITPVEYINRKKMKIARELLDEQKLDVSEISTRLGFSSVSYFRRLFKEAYGFSPTEYIINFRDL